MLVMLPVPVAPTSVVKMEVSVTTRLEDEAVKEAVVAGGAAAGNREGRALFTSVGRAAYQEGVLPAESEDWSWETRTDGLAKASCWTDEGIAVARMPRRDWNAGSVGRESCCAAAPVEATASRANDLNCIFAKITI